MGEFAKSRKTGPLSGTREMLKRDKNIAFICLFSFGQSIELVRRIVDLTCDNTMNK